jgi:hypothetical protein
MFQSIDVHLEAPGFSSIMTGLRLDVREPALSRSSFGGSLRKPPVVPAVGTHCAAGQEDMNRGENKSVAILAPGTGNSAPLRFSTGILYLRG